MIVPLIGMLFVGMNPMSNKTFAVAMPFDEGLTRRAVMAEPRPPDGTVNDEAGFKSVLMVTSPLAVSLPMVKPDRVMVKTVPPGQLTAAVVITMEVEPGTEEVAVIPVTDEAPTAIVGVAVAAKNPLG